METYDDILLPTDGSKGTEETVGHALTLARNHDATLHVLYVVDRRRFLAADKETQDDVIEALREQGEVAIDDVTVTAEDAGVTVETAMEEGIPHKTIQKYATNNDVDVVTMGTHGQTGRDRVATLGSVTERVLKGVDVPVLVVNIE
ncbi:MULTISPECIES: universal stress protein [Halomicrobium]|uniref:UspA domain protein n=2 Tax=Halomicrobium mukohataei TaxID=57705 RepID=C7P337_HALMD|nr:MULTISPECIES: universal stress protein [Halomicrobium]ACV47509.1 UspA domain protein [Halomicrobium mukohataei DSM 12286]QCD65973.1 universal stress protein [Halomicrobium mukohataei]QFR20778.1 universal stress protein [Halomicrobium sp. ZPS1]